MGLLEHAERELKLAKMDSPDSDYGGALYGAIMELIKVFAAQGHSGMSASITRQLFNKLANYENITPLTFKDDEWSDVQNWGNGKEVYQNKRMSAVFKDGKDGIPHYINAISWKDEKGVCWHGSADGISSSQNIDTSKAFVPKTFYIDVVSEEVAKDDWEFHIKDKTQLDEVFKYYIKRDREVVNK